ncbi:MAG: putative amino-acid ABC transporter-binding protein YhdW [Gammaproteobacteria bacterium]|nr:putative amino-acid ABC transporter-binding protein YhdW [Gammaproteobacteria bacterium]
MNIVKSMAAAAALSVAAVGANAATLDDVKEKGFVQCGVDGGLPGFSAPDDSGQMRGIDADVCYAVAAAVFGDSSKAKFTPLTAKERFTALSSGEIDVLSRNTTHTLHRDSALGINFTYYNYIDGQGFMVKKNLGVTSAKELDGAAVCVQQGTTTELNLADFFRANGMEFTPVGYDTSVQTREGFDGGSCDVLTSDKSQLAAIRTELKDPDGAAILPETISKEPLGPVVRQGDDQWFNIVKWVLYALINADEMGITSANVDEMKDSGNPAIARIMGTEGEMGKDIGLSADWAYNAIKQVGNYDEIYQRNVAPLGLAREGSVNALWTEGGVLYAPPVR